MFIQNVILYKVLKSNTPSQLSSLSFFVQELKVDYESGKESWNTEKEQLIQAKEEISREKVDFILYIL